nr:immunoglobulin light chain junction region [Macaca mulatta]
CYSHGSGSTYIF